MDMDIVEYIHATPQPLPYQSECRDFREFNNLTEFQAKLANKLCYLETVSHYDRYKANQYQNDLQGLQIASLVLSAITVLSLIIFMISRLFIYIRQRKSEQQLRI